MVDTIASSHDRSHQTNRTYLGALRLEGYHLPFNILLFHVAGRQYALKKPPSSNDEPSDNELISEVVENEKSQLRERAYPPGITNRR